MKKRIKRAVSLYFSPSDATRQIVHRVAQGLHVQESLELDRTSFAGRWAGETLREGDVAVIGMPVYYGRAPKILVEFFRYIEAKEIPAIVVVTYGNRDYEDGLLELVNVSKKMGFLPVAAGAFVGQHSFTAKMGSGRPDVSDLAEAYALGESTAKIIQNAEEITGDALTVKGKFPYTPGLDLPVAPVTDPTKCTECMKCQLNCPVQAIHPTDPTQTDAWRCLMCGKCMQECEANARKISQPALLEKITIMETMFIAPKSTEIFYADL